MPTIQDNRKVIKFYTLNRVPSTLTWSSLHFVGSLLTLQLPVRERHSRAFRLHLPSVPLAIQLAHGNLRLAIVRAMSGVKFLCGSHVLM